MSRNTSPLLGSLQWQSFKCKVDMCACACACVRPTYHSLVADTVPFHGNIGCCASKHQSVLKWLLQTTNWTHDTLHTLLLLCKCSLKTLTLHTKTPHELPSCWKLCGTTFPLPNNSFCGHKQTINKCSYEGHICFLTL